MSEVVAYLTLLAILAAALAAILLSFDDEDDGPGPDAFA